MTAEKSGPANNVVKNNNIVSREIEGEAVLLNLDNGNYYVINANAAIIWNNIGIMENDEIITELIKNNDIDREAAVIEFNEFLKELIDEGMLCIQA